MESVATTGLYASCFKDKIIVQKEKKYYWK